MSKPDVQQQEGTSTKSLPVTYCCTQSRILKTSFTWTIQNFRYHLIKKEELQSSAFSADNDKFKFSLLLHPEGGFEMQNKCKKYVSIYLRLESKDSVSASLKFYVLDKTCVKIMVYTTNCVFSSSEKINGCGGFIPVELLQQSADLLPNGHLTVGCDINLMVDIQPVSCPRLAKNAINLEKPDSKLIPDFSAIFKNKNFTDVELRVKDETFSAHRAILAARSKVFAAMFEHEMEERSNNTVEITDVEPTDFEILLHYIYTGSITYLVDISPELLVAADKYAMLNLKVICEAVLSSRLNVENASFLLVIADMHSAPKLKAGCVDFIQSHISEVTKTDGWNKMIHERPNLTKDL